MKKKTWLFQLLYYVLVLLIYIVFSVCVLLFMESMAGMKQIGLATIMGIFNLTFFLATPILTAILMRFSLLKWYVDPFAAAIVPLFIYGGMIVNVTGRTNDLVAAFREVNLSLSNDGGEGWYFLGGLFLFCLLASFSIARKKGKNISYRLLETHLK